ncbi:HEAT repeat domain-containing protein [Sinorhizobium meliloti]|uniref:HEAT repeat domain-containing protein n=1 Tax=Rhizobium meliloti TaxID=382 RepID=UPI00299D6091|nr:hypothetical protein [Sinorhizobium meliloti]MDW9690563.1 hypothetical protein [Sinorhizobium meliloti]MDW9715408.1 hypothetical protein [Sinorhizobium meliloti]MDW9756644.1 hypothetical protein [Sinorhizobium meliloti]
MKSVLKIVNEYAEADREQTRSNACIALAAVGTPEAVERLAEIGRADRSEMVRETAAVELVSAPAELSQLVVRRSHEELFGKDWLPSFKLLQQMAMASRSQVPLARAVPGRERRVLEALRLNWRLRTTQASPFFIFRQLHGLAFLGAALASLLLTVLWFELTGQKMVESGVAFGVWFAASLLVWLVMVTAMPTRLAYLSEAAPYADVVWICLVGAAGFLLVAIPVGSELQLDLWRTALAYFLFLVLPVAAARLGIAAGGLRHGRLWYMASVLASGLGAAALAFVTGVFVFDVAFSRDLIEADFTTSPLAIFGIACTLFLCCYYGLAGVARDFRPLERRRALSRVVGTTTLGITLLVIGISVTVPPELDLAGELPKTNFDLRHGASLGLNITRPGKLYLEATGDRNIVLEFDGREIDDNGEDSTDLGVATETLDEHVESGAYSVSVRHLTFEADPDEYDYLWVLKNRFLTWLGRPPEAEGPPSVLSPLHLSVRWSPDAKP